MKDKPITVDDVLEDIGFFYSDRGMPNSVRDEAKAQLEELFRQAIYDTEIHRKIEYKGMYEVISGDLNLELSEGDADRILDKLFGGE